MAFLQNSKYARSVTEQGVDCGACGRHIQLDKRNGYRYYAENWTKHLKTKKCAKKQKVFDDDADQVCKALERSTNADKNAPT